MALKGYSSRDNTQQRILPEITVRWVPVPTSRCMCMTPPGTKLALYDPDVHQEHALHHYSRVYRSGIPGLHRQYRSLRWRIASCGRVDYGWPYRRVHHVCRSSCQWLAYRWQHDVSAGHESILSSAIRIPRGPGYARRKSRQSFGDFAVLIFVRKPIRSSSWILRDRQTTLSLPPILQCREPTRMGCWLRPILLCSLPS